MHIQTKLLNSLSTFRGNIQRRDIFAILLSLIPVYLIIVLIDQYVVNVPYWDIWEWSVSRFALDTPFSLEDFWLLKNEHRVFVPQLIGLLIAKTSSLDMIARNFAKIPILILAFISLYLIYRSRADSPASPLVAIPFSLLTFTLAFWPSWIDPGILATPLSILSFLFAIWAISSLAPGWKALSLAALMGAISSLSFATGNATWIVIGVAMWFVGYRDWRYYLAWVVVSLGILFPYTYDLMQSQTIIRRTPLGELPNLLDYFLTFIGVPLTASNYPIQIQAKTMGIIGIVGFIILMIGINRYITDGLKKMLPWIGIAAWVLFGGVAAAFGREALLGVAAAKASRYALLQSLFWIAFVAILAIALSEPRRSMNRGEHRFRVAMMDLFPIAMVLIIGIGFVNMSLFKLDDESFDDFAIRLNEGRSCLLIYQIADDSCLELLFPDANRIRELMPGLVAHKATFLYSQEFIIEQAFVNALRPEATYQTFRSIDGERFDVIFQHPPSSLTWQFNLPEKYESILLNTGLLIDIPGRYDTAASDGVLFQVTVAFEGKKKQKLYKFILPREIGQGFELIQIDLSEYAGEAIDLTFTTSPGLDENAHAKYDWAMWLKPDFTYR